MHFIPKKPGQVISKWVLYERLSSYAGHDSVLLMDADMDLVGFPFSEFLQRVYNGFLMAL